MRVLLVGAALAAAAGCGSAPRAAVGASPAVVDPFVDPLDAILRVRSVYGECTGSVVAPRVVLTSRPCLLAISQAVATEDAPIDPARLRMRARIGGGVVGFRAVPVASVVERACFGVAGIVTAEPLGVPPLAMRLSGAITPGEAVRVVGYGRCSARAGGVRGVGFSGPIRAVTPTALQIDAHACAGDVGGAVLSATSHDLVGVLLRDPAPPAVDGAGAQPAFDVPAGEVARLDGPVLDLVLHAVLAGYGVTPGTPLACP